MYIYIYIHIYIYIYTCNAKHACKTVVLDGIIPMYFSFIYVYCPNGLCYHRIMYKCESDSPLRARNDFSIPLFR